MLLAYLIYHQAPDRLSLVWLMNLLALSSFQDYQARFHGNHSIFVSKSPRTTAAPLVSLFRNRHWQHRVHIPSNGNSRESLLPREIFLYTGSKSMGRHLL